MPGLRIDKRLNLVIPVYGDEVPRVDAKGAPVLENGKPVIDVPVVAYVHSMPLSTEVVDRYFLVIAQTYAAIFSQGLGIVGGPAVAMKLLRATAMSREVWEDDPKSGIVGVKNGVVEEIRRLTNVIARDGAGAWQPLPLDVAVSRGILSEDDQAEVENAIAFFIVASATLPRSQRKEMIEAAADLWSARTTSLDCTAFSASLKTSTETGNSGATSPAPAAGAPGPADAPTDAKPSLIPV